MPDVSFSAIEYERQGPRGAPWRTLDYCLQDHDFPLAVSKALGIGKLSELGLGAAMPLRTRLTDQKTAWHTRYYDTFGTWDALYDDFIKQVIARYFSEPFYVQAIPTLRIHLPGNVAVGEFHTDRDYGHPEHELSFWVTLTEAFDTNSLWIESNGPPGSYASVRASPGQMVVFDAINLRHGNQINTTGATRVSFDFRCLAKRDYVPNGRISVNAGRAFMPGAYYASAPVAPFA